MLKIQFCIYGINYFLKYISNINNMLFLHIKYVDKNKTCYQGK